MERERKKRIEMIAIPIPNPEIHGKERNCKGRKNTGRPWKPRKAEEVMSKREMMGRERGRHCHTERLDEEVN